MYTFTGLALKGLVHVTTMNLSRSEEDQSRSAASFKELVIVVPPSFTALHHARMEGSVTLRAVFPACPVADVVFTAAALYI